MVWRGQQLLAFFFSPPTHPPTHPPTYLHNRIVRWVKSQGKKVRAQGALHSWSNTFAADNTHVIFLDKLKGTSFFPPPPSSSFQPPRSPLLTQ